MQSKSELLTEHVAEEKEPEPATAPSTEEPAKLEEVEEAVEAVGTVEAEVVSSEPAPEPQVITEATEATTAQPEAEPSVGLKIPEPPTWSPSAEKDMTDEQKRVSVMAESLDSLDKLDLDDIDALPTEEEKPAEEDVKEPAPAVEAPQQPPAQPIPEAEPTARPVLVSISEWPLDTPHGN